MQTTVHSLSASHSQAPLPNGFPKYLTLIEGTRPGELHEPGNLIREAISVLRGCEASRGKSAAATFKVIGLLYASALAAKSLGGRWSTCGTYDPLPDYLTIEELAKTKLPKLRGPKHPISLLRSAIAGSIASLRERPA